MCARRWLLRSSLGVAAALLGAEIILRFFLGGPTYTEFDPKYGKRAIPNARVVQWEEGYFNGRVNELGHFDGPTPPRATLPILAIGDSMTEARQVAIDESYPNVLERETGIPVINAGQAGWSPVNYVAYLRDMAGTFGARALVVQLGGGDFDDLVDSDRRLHIEKGPEGWDIAQPSRQKDIGAARTLFRLAMQDSALLTQVVRRAGMLWKEQSSRLRGKFTPVTLGTTGCDTPVEPWVVDAFGDLLKRLRGAAPQGIVLYLPRLNYRRDGVVDECAEREPLIRAAALRSGFQYVDATPALLRAYRDTGQMTNGFENSTIGTGHLNALGHRTVAQVLLPFLDEKSGRVP